MKPPLAASEAWHPLPASQWDHVNARHLLRRAGWAATPAEVESAVRDGLPNTLARLFPGQPPPFPQPESVTKATERSAELRRERRQTEDPERRRELDREDRELQRGAYNDLSLRWLQQASRPATAAFEKWLLFLSDVYVISVERIRASNLLFQHLDILRQHATGPAPALTKAVSRSPAMVVYLDLQGSQRRRPNENFARELFELFTLGEGNYTEDDVKQAARAFTGYRQRDGAFRFVRAQHDPDAKTIFGRTDRFTGDGVVDLVYQQPAAGTFLPREMARFYLSETSLPHEFFEPLAAWWRAKDYNLQHLCLRFFSSRLFYHPAYRANYIKSPVQFYLGLLQDLNLDVTPVARTTLVPLRQMGQQLFQPPNVRGWVGGRTWINASTLAARRQLVNTLFNPLNEERLNADDKAALEIARAEGATRFAVDDDRIAAFASLDVEAIIDRFVNYFIPVPVSDEYRSTLREFITEGGTVSAQRVRQAAVTVLQAPDYHLC